MPQPRADLQRIHEHVERLGVRHPPIDLATVDYTVLDADAVRARFAAPLAFMARVEMAVERNVLELALMLPGVSETDRLFYADVWGPQEVRHGIVLDTLGQQLGMPAAPPEPGELSPRVRVLGALAHLPAVHEVIRLLYYLTGAATERSALLAYQAMSTGLEQMGEQAIKRTVVDTIKVQEPGHFAFYRLSALQMVQAGVLAPWQLHLARVLRARTFRPVGVGSDEQATELGGVLVGLGLEPDLERHVRDITRVETQLLSARDQGLAVPDYAMAAFHDAIDRHREGASRQSSPAPEAVHVAA